MKFFFSLLILLSQSYAAVLGDFSNQKILPGYITFDENSPFYHGIENDSFRMELIDKATPSQILHTFFKNGSFSNKLFDDFINQYKVLRAQTMKFYCIDNFRSKVDSYNDCNEDFFTNKKFLKKFKDSKISNAIYFLENSINYVLENSHLITLSTLNSKENAEFYDHFFSMLELFSAMTQSESQNAKHDSVVKAVIKGKNFVVDKNVIKNHNLHSSNLKNIHDTSQLFYSYQDLQQLKEQGYDLSTLDPYDSELWRKPIKSISKIKFDSYDHRGIEQLEAIFDKDFIPKFLDKKTSINVVYEGDDLSGGKTPKFNVYIQNVKFKIKFITPRFKGKARYTPQSSAIRNLWGSEANVEPVVNQLANAVGYNVDPTYFKNSVRLYVDEDKVGMDFDSAIVDLIKRLHERYMIESNITDTFHNIQTDEDGRKYILLKSVSLEQKSNIKTDMNMGFYRHMGLGKSLKREHRALYLFMAWIADPDIKDNNTKVKLVPYIKENGSKRFKVVLSNSDMGGAIGIGYPNLYNYDLVKKWKTKNGKIDEVSLRYLRLFDYNMKHAINFDDARWIVRRMSQISVDQLIDSFIYAGYPELVARYYALLVSKKRNQLIKVFGLENDTFIDDGGEKFTIKLQDEFTGTIENFEEFFRNGHFIDPENKLFDKDLEYYPRFWGVSWKNRDIEQSQDNFLKDLGRFLLTKSISIGQSRVLDRMHLGMQGINLFKKNLFLDDKFISFGDGFIQGLDLGIMGIIPMRHIIENPDKTSDKPFLLLDVVRFGTYLSAFDPLFEKIGITPSKLGLNGMVGAKVFYLKESIKTTPVKSMSDYFKVPYETVNVQKLDWRKFLSNRIKDIKDDENYIVSHYIGAKAGMRLRPMNVVPFMSLISNIGSISTKRYLIGVKESEIYVRRAKENLHFFSNAFNIFDMLLRIPVLEFDLSYQKLNENVFQFNKNNEFDRFYECNDLNYGSDCTENVIKERNTVSRNTHFYIGIPGLIGFDANRQYIYRNYNDNNNEEFYERMLIFQNSNLRFRQILGITEDHTAKIYTNSDNEIRLAIDLKYNNPAARSEDFVNIIDKYAPLLSDDFISMRDDVVHQYMGHLVFDVNIVFATKAIENFFELTDNEICSLYSSLNSLESNCESLVSLPEDVFQLLKLREKARYYYNNIKNISIVYLKNRNLKKLAKFFIDKNFKLRLTKFMIQISKAKHFKRDISFLSDVNPFPNDLNELKESDENRGKHSKFKVSKFKLYGDDLLEKIEKFFFSRYSVFN